MERFYQYDYHQAGLTTDLPTPAELEQLMATRFAGTQRDGAYLLALLKILNVLPGKRVLDYGASWGYYTWQLLAAGYRTQGLEISAPRAAFGKHLGLTINTNLADLSPPFDVVFSSHVLEHVLNPREVLRDMARLTAPGGYVIAVTPNGSPEHQQRAAALYHRLWGFVHPVLLTAEFWRRTQLFSRVWTISKDDFTPADFAEFAALERSELNHSTLLLIGQVNP